jgi:hypothetical protein
MRAGVRLPRALDFGNAQHHGTPEERRDALLTGYRSGDPSARSSYLPPASGS